MKIALTSTHCCGKTTLVKELAKLPQFKDYNIFTEKTKELKEDYKVKLNDDSELVSQYIFAGERAKELHSGENILSDRSIYCVCSYTLGAKSIDSWDKETFVRGMVPLMKIPDLVIYIDPKGIEIEDNGLRSIDKDYRDKIDFVIREMLVEYKPKKLLKISGSTSERIGVILKELNMLSK